jgi:hypothetical protein
MKGIVTLGETIWLRENVLRRALRAARTSRERDRLARQLAGIVRLYALLERVRKIYLDKARPTQVIVCPAERGPMRSCRVIGSIQAAVHPKPQASTLPVEAAKLTEYIEYVPCGKLPRRLICLPLPSRSVLPNSLNGGSLPMFLDLLLSSSDRTLQEIMLARLDQSASLRKELHQVLDRLSETEAEGETARLLLELRSGHTRKALQHRLAFPSEKRTPAFAPKLPMPERRRA